MYIYRGNTVRIPYGAEVSSIFRPDGGLASVIQEALDLVEPWEKGLDPIETFDLPREMEARVVRLYNSEEPVWAVNPRIYTTAQRANILRV